MKKTIFIVMLLTAFISAETVHAQQNPGRNPRIRGAMMEKVREAKWAYIIYELHLDEKRANRLLPIYRAYEEEKKAIFRGSIKQVLQDDSEMTDEKAEQLMNARLENAQKLLDLKEKYKNEFLKVLTPTEVLALQRAETEFAMKIQMERQKRRRNR
jgi:RecG-like helicase